MYTNPFQLPSYLSLIPRPRLPLPCCCCLNIKCLGAVCRYGQSALVHLQRKQHTWLIFHMYRPTFSMATNRKQHVTRLLDVIAPLNVIAALGLDSQMCRKRFSQLLQHSCIFSWNKPARQTQVESILAAMATVSMHPWFLIWATLPSLSRRKWAWGQC